MKQKTLFGVRGTWDVKAWYAGGHRRHLKWHEVIDPNKIVFVGLDDLLSVYFFGGTQTLAASWYLGMMTGSPVVADTDTMASHPGWTEFTSVSQANRLAWGHDAPAARQVSNSTPVTYACNADAQTAGGIFCVNDNTLGGATGLLFNGGAFSGGDRGLNNGETIDLTMTLSVTSLT